MRARQRLLVSIHDVTPALMAPVNALWNLCREHDCVPALLVVPNWHGAWALDQHPPFVDWLQARAAEGAEIILHGERHDEVGSPRHWRDTVRAIGRTAREGEFLTLDHDAALARIQRGVELLSRLQLAPVGFIPPAWLARDATHNAVRELGLGFSEDANGIRLHRQNRRVDAPALRWSGRTAVRAWGSRVMADVRWRTWRSCPLVRLALHPQDLSHPVTAQSVTADVARWTRARTVLPYGAL